VKPASIAADVGGGGLLLLDEGATWTGVGALALSGLLLALGIFLFARWRRAAAREIAQIQATSKRTESLLNELRRAFADTRVQGRRFSALGELGSTLDLDAALERALRIVSELAEAEAAMIVLRQDGEPIAATYGLTGDEAERDLLGIPPEAGHARAVKLGYLYTPDEAANDEFRLSGGVAVPLVGESRKRVGTLAVFWRREERPVTDEELQRFEELAGAFGPALENAQLFLEARLLADTDPLTDLRSRRYFEERLRRECARARRYQRALGLLLFEADGGVQDFVDAGKRIRSAVRGTDVACHLGEARFAVIMPEGGQAGAVRLLRRLQFALGGRVDNGGEAVHLPAGLVEFRSEDDASTFLRRAEEALQRVKDAAQERLAAAR
jgi:diguanylate cyclase (GGDEF)-like protein